MFVLSQTFTPQEREHALEECGYQTEDQVGDGGVLETCEFLLETPLFIGADSGPECGSVSGSELEFTEEQTLQTIAEQEQVTIEVHTESLEEPLVVYKPSVPTSVGSNRVIRLFRQQNEEEMMTYLPIVSNQGKKQTRDIEDGPLRPPSTSKRTNITVNHTNPDIQVLWRLSSDMDMTKKICSCVIDCEVVQCDPMEVAKEIVERAKERQQQGGKLLPSYRTTNKQKTYTEEQIQETKDYQKLQRWRQATEGKGDSRCSDQVRNYLDTHLPGWRDILDLDEQAMQAAIEIVKRAKERQQQGGSLLPSDRMQAKQKQYTEEQKQETKDCGKLQRWRLATKGKGDCRCSNQVQIYLDEHLPGWRDNLDAQAMQAAMEIVKRAKERQQQGGKLLPSDKTTNKQKQYTEEQVQESKDCQKLTNWRLATEGKCKGKCSEQLQAYLDVHLPGWRDTRDLDAQAMQTAMEIVKRAKERQQKGGKLLPSDRSSKTTYTEEQIQETKDYQKLTNWKKATEGKGKGKCSEQLQAYLDEHLPGWRDERRPTNKTESTTSNPKKSTKITPKTQKPKNPKIPATLKPEHPQPIKPQLSLLHQQYKTLHSTNLHQTFVETPDLWHAYHALAEANDQTFATEDVPRNRIIQEMKRILTKRTKHVADLGCGKAHIMEAFRGDSRFIFHNFDHVACNESVTACDISELTTLEDGQMDICILSMAMWGSNCKRYIVEAHRVLETHGVLYIIEPTKRWTEQEDQLGGRLRAWLEEENRFHINSAQIDKFCMFVCTKL